MYSQLLQVNDSKNEHEMGGSPKRRRTDASLNVHSFQEPTITSNVVNDDKSSPSISVSLNSAQTDTGSSEVDDTSKKRK